jgi:hypothetical protein
MILEGNDIKIYGLVVLRQQLKSEIRGLKFRFSAYAFIKKKYGMKGNRQKVYDQFSDFVEKAIYENEGGKLSRSLTYGIKGEA